MGPAVDEQRGLGGQAIDIRRGRPRVAVAAQVIGAQGVDGDEQELQILRHGVGNRLKRRRAQGLGRGVLAVAVLIDAVVGPVARARITLRIAVVAVAAAEEARVAVVVEIGQTLPEGQQLAAQAGVRRSRLAGGLVFRGREDRHQRKKRQTDYQREIPASGQSTPAQEQREGRSRDDDSDDHRHQGPGQELKILDPTQSNQSDHGHSEQHGGDDRGLPPAHPRKARARPRQRERKQARQASCPGRA